MFLFQIHTKTPSDRLKGEKGLSFRLFHSSTAQNGMADTMNLAVQV
jgi:hypothetical protein